jgi:hypothetical protein
MKTIVVTLILLFGLAEVGSSQTQRTFHAIVVKDEMPAHRSTRVVDYDCDFVWVAQDFGDSRDFGGNTIPGVFVQSKTHGRWLQIMSVSATGAKFGKSPANAAIQAPWDFTVRNFKGFVPLPIPTGGAIHLPDKIVYDNTRASFLVYFDSDSNIESMTTVLLIPKRDLIEAFDYYAKNE